MDLKQIERLMVAMGRTGMKKIVLKQEGFELELEKECSGYAMEMVPPPPQPTAFRLPPFAEERRESPQAETSQETVSSKFVTSPMVGTFYSSPSPDSPAFIKVGDLVEEDTVVCIIEAMKVMNEVKAGIRGKVAEVLVNNGDPVEFGTKIVRIV